MPAGKVLGVVVVALLVALLFNTEALVRAGEGMKQGPERDIVLTIGRPLDDVAGFVGLHLPRQGLDRAFGQESKTARRHRARAGLARDPARERRQRPAGAQTSFSCAADRGAAARLLVTGDSRPASSASSSRPSCPTTASTWRSSRANGTGLTNPGFFNWEVNAKQEIAARSPDAVVVALGGNDGFNLTVRDGPPARHPGWQQEFARRAAVVIAALSDGKRPVYWVPPPSARDPVFDRIYRSQNGAVKRAAAAVRGGRFVDDYSRSTRAATPTRS